MTHPVRLRKRARKLAIQALYQWQLTGDSISAVLIECIKRTEEEFDIEYFKQALTTIGMDPNEGDQAFSEYLDRKIESLDPIELAILRVSTFELQHRLDIPYRVVINEGVEWAKIFGATESHKFINGVLDKLARRLRQAEIGPATDGVE